MTEPTAEEARQLMRSYCTDPGWHAGLTLLCSRLLRDDARVWECVDLNVGLIDFPAMLEDGTFSHGERLMVEAAASLFNGSISVNLQDMACTLSERNLALVLIAIARKNRSRGLEALLLRASDGSI